MFQAARFRLGWVVLVVLAAAATDARTVDVVGREFQAAFVAADWKHAAALGRELVELTPDDPVAHYNLGCALARGGEPAAALDAVLASARRGFADVELLASDTDLVAIRSLEGYAALRQRVTANAAAARADLERKAAARSPIVIAPRELSRKKAAPVLVVLHGYGGDADNIAALYKDVARERGMILLAPRAVNPTANGGYHWGDPATADFLIDRALSQLRAERAIDDARIVLTGFSQGGAVAFSLGLAQPERFVGVIPVAGAYRPAMLKSAALGSDRPGRKPRIYIMVGDQDRALDANRQAATELAAAGYPVHLTVFPKLGHTYPQDSRDAIAKALGFVLDAVP